MALKLNFLCYQDTICFTFVREFVREFDVNRIFKHLQLQTLLAELKILAGNNFLYMKQEIFSFVSAKNVDIIMSQYRGVASTLYMG